MIRQNLCGLFIVFIWKFSEILKPMIKTTYTHSTHTHKHERARTKHMQTHTHTVMVVNNQEAEMEDIQR